MTPIRTLLTIAIAVLATGCEYDIHLPTTPTAIVETKTTTPVSDVVEFRVVGDLPLVTVDVRNALDGLSTRDDGAPLHVDAVARRARWRVHLADRARHRERVPARVDLHQRDHLSRSLVGAALQPARLGQRDVPTGEMEEGMTARRRVDATTVAGLPASIAM